MKWTYLLAFMSSGCLADAWSDLQDNFTTTATTGGSSTTSGTVPTTSDGVQLEPGGDRDRPARRVVVSGDDTQEPETTTGDMANLPPTIELFTVTPKDPNEKQLSEAGPAELQLVASDDVVKVRLSLDGVELAKLKPGDFPRDWEALSAKDNGLAREFEVVVEDAEGLTAKATDQLDVQLPQSGAEKCSFEDPSKGAVTSVISALKYTPDAIVAVGTRDTGAGLRLTVWKLDPDCEVLNGWPRSIADWTAKPTFKTMTSLGAAVDVDEAGNIIVAGNFVDGRQAAELRRAADPGRGAAVGEGGPGRRRGHGGRGRDGAVQEPRVRRRRAAHERRPGADRRGDLGLHRRRRVSVHSAAGHPQSAVHPRGD
jgi:hypothetical protein